MNLLQTKIRNQFNRASSSYEEAAALQKQSAKFLVAKLRKLISQNSSPTTILDLGSGTGFLPELLLKYYPDSLYLLNDLAPKMLAIAKFKFANQRNFLFLEGDLESLDFTRQELIISNLALQWVDDLWLTLKKISTKANIFAFSTLLHGSFQEWEIVLKKFDPTFKLKSYPTKESLIAYCNQIKTSKQFSYWIKEFPVATENPQAFIQYLKKIGATTSPKELSLANLKKLLKNYRQNIQVTYKIFFGIFN